MAVAIRDSVRTLVSSPGAVCRPRVEPSIESTATSTAADGAACPWFNSAHSGRLDAPLRGVLPPRQPEPMPSHTTVRSSLSTAEDSTRTGLRRKDTSWAAVPSEDAARRRSICGPADRCGSCRRLAFERRFDPVFGQTVAEARSVVRRCRDSYRDFPRATPNRPASRSRRLRTSASARRPDDLMTVRASVGLSLPSAWLRRKPRSIPNRSSSCSPGVVRLFAHLQCRRGPSAHREGLL